MFTMEWAYELPFGKGQTFDIKNKALDTIASGRKINGTFAKYSGTPLNRVGRQSFTSLLAAALSSPTRSRP